jgi:predicted RND superfamily exporter protein
LLYAATGILPNILPVLTTLGIMGWSGVKIDVGTVLIAAISLGIAIDDTIHFLNEYQLCSGKNKKYTARLELVYSRMGEPIILTSVLVCLGFIVMVFSSYIPIVYFGSFVSLNIVFALMYDLLLTPAIISTTGVFNRSDRKKLET